jgi:MYXO-CTERM domain-containing protein
MEPLPAGGVPKDQTIEGGAQVRVTPSGFQKLTSVLPGVVNDAIADGFCVGQQSVGVGIADVYVCDTAACAGGATGCPVGVTLQSLVMSVPNDQTLRLDGTFDVSVPVHVTADWIVGGDSTCTLTVTLDDGRVEADIGFGIDPADGELTIQLTGIETFDISGLGISGCGVLGDILDAVLGFVADLLSTEIGNFIIDALSPVIDGFLQGMLPDPLGLEGVLNLGDLLAGVAPGVNADLETRAVAGGYVSLPSQGLSVGMIVGLNSDQDPSTRTWDLDNEAAYCVPNRPAPDFAAPPASLPLTSRSTFGLAPAGEFLGMPDPAHDFAIGVSETTLDLAGHHIVSSGAMCLGVGSSLVPQLNLGIVGILVPSLAELGETQREPLLLVLRPQQPLDFEVGDGTESSPRLTIHINDLDVDFYAFILERYIRAFTITLNLDLGLNLDFVIDGDGNPAIEPQILGLDADTIDVEVTNAEFLNESADQLEAVFPTIFDLLLPIVADGLGTIAIPDLMGFRLENLQFTKVVTSEDDFLAIYATLSATMSKMRELEKSAPFNDVARSMKPSPAVDPVETDARLVRVTTPAPEKIRSYYMGRAGGEITEIELALGGRSNGGPMEWSWRIDGGLWHVWSDDPHPTLRDDAFTVQGKHLLEVRAREIGDYRTADPTPVELPIAIDSVAPWLPADAFWLEGDEVMFSAEDLVFDADELEYALGLPEREQPRTAWTPGGRFAIDAIDELSRAGAGRFALFVRDGAGNVARVTLSGQSVIVGFHGRAPASDGCSCHVGQAPHSHGEGGTAAAILGALAVLAVALRRRLLAIVVRGARAVRRHGLRGAGPIVLAIVAIASPGCSCDSEETALPDCMLDEECQSVCNPDEVGICFDGTCTCLPDIPIGQIGMYSDMAVSPVGGAWVSAYNSTYGDLMVAYVTQDGRVPNEAYEFIDGVPPGPVVYESSDVRGGIREEGDDVGLYSSIAVDVNGAPMVSYYDRSHGSLRFAFWDGELWQTMTIDAGEPGAEDVGRYSSVTIGADGRPGVAYFALLTEPGGTGRTEVRFAQASSTTPATVSDWSLFIVDEAPLPPPPEDPENAPTDLIEGVGLFISSARLSTGAPVLAYYDRLKGDLRVAFFDAANNVWQDPIVADGADGSDVGLYPSITTAPDDKVFVTYVDATRDNLLFVEVGGLPEVVDDGYRIDGNTQDGLPLPVYHFVGDDSSLVTNGAYTAVAYQDATSHELLQAARNVDGGWDWVSVAGSDELPWDGGYGFYAAADLDGDDIVMSSYVIDQQAYDYWVELFRLPAVIQ